MLLRSLMLSCGFALFLAACRTPSGTSDVSAVSPPTSPPVPEPAPVPAVPEQPIQLTLRVEAITKKGQRTIDSKEVLRTGDRLALHVGVNEAAYVYVGLLSAEGTRTILFPKKGNELLSTGTEHRIPPPGQWFKLDQDTGQEDIFVYASRKPLTSHETLALLQRDGTKVRGASPPATASRPKKPTKRKEPTQPAQPQEEGGPEALSSDTRGLQVVGADETENQAENGVTRMHFPIRHRR